METKENKQPTPAPKRTRKTAPPDWYKTQSTKINFYGVILTGCLVIVTGWYYSRNYSQNQVLLKQNKIQVNELLKNDSINRNKDREEDRKMSMRDSIQYKEMRAMLKQANDIHRQEIVGEQTLDYARNGNLPYIHLTDLKFDTLPHYSTMQTFFTNDGNRPVVIDTCFIYVYNGKYDYFLRIKDSTFSAISPGRNIDYPNRILPLAIVSDVNTFYYTSLTVYDNLTGIFYYADDYFKNPSHDKTGFNTTYLSEEDRNKFIKKINIFEAASRAGKKSHLLKRLKNKHVHIDTIDENWVGINANTIVVPEDISAIPVIITADYEKRSPEMDHTPNLYINNISKTYPFYIYIDNSLLYCNDGKKVVFSKDSLECKNGLLATGYHSFDIIYDYNQDIHKFGCLKIRPHQNLNIVIQ